MSTATAADILASVQQALSDLLRQFATDLPLLNLTAAADQNAVEQTVEQWQEGQGPTLTQAQSASQVNTTVQIDDLASALLPLATTTYAAVSQAAEAIWQLQIGCLIFCVDTHQIQYAEQANTTVQMVVLPPGAPATAIAAVADIATQLIWQVQIGCLFYCLDATERQTAATRNTLVLIESWDGPAPPPPKRTPAPPETRAPLTPLAPVQPLPGPLGSTAPAGGVEQGLANTASRSTTSGPVVMFWARSRSTSSGSSGRFRRVIASSDATRREQAQSPISRIRFVLIVLLLPRSSDGIGTRAPAAGVPAPRGARSGPNPRPLAALAAVAGEGAGTGSGPGAVVPLAAAALLVLGLTLGRARRRMRRRSGAGEDEIAGCV